MRLVAFGIIAAMLLGAGCALQPGDPGEATEPSTELRTSQSTAKIHQATTPAGASSANAPPNPEPSPWVPTDPGSPGLNDDSTGANPEPSPWHPDVMPKAGATGDPETGGAGPTSGTSLGSSPNRPGHLGER
jgi:hypothetical protein